MLTRLLTAFTKQLGSPRTRRRHQGYLRHFSRWCRSEGIERLPTSVDVLTRYLLSIAQPTRRQLSTLDLLFEFGGQPRPSCRLDLEDVLVAIGLRAEKRTPAFALRKRLSESTRALYQERIARFSRWCRGRKIRPSKQALATWLDELNLAPATTLQYASSINAWSQMPRVESAPPLSPAGAPIVPEAPAAELPDEAPQQPAPDPRRRGALTLRTAEKRLLYQLGRTGVAEHHRHAMGFSRVSAKRLALLTKAGLLKEHSGLAHIDGALTSVRYYSLASRGRRWLETKGVEQVYRWNPQQLRHDLYLTDVYCQLPPRIQRTWVTETQIIEQLQAHGTFRPGEAVDAAILVDGQPFAIEVAIGYKPAAIAKKQACIRTVFGGRGLLIK